MYSHPGQSAFFSVGGTDNGAVGQKVYSYVVLTDGVNDATIKFFKDSGLTDQIWEDTVVGADLARPHTLHAVGPVGNPGSKGAQVYAEISGTGASCYITYD